jgi:hypothetical protein
LVDDYIRAADKKPGEFLFAALRRAGQAMAAALLERIERGERRPSGHRNKW